MSLKTRLHQHLISTLQKRIAYLTDQRSQLNIDSTQSGKASAGDKHEVGIAMAQLEIEKLDQQLNNLKSQVLALKQLDPTQNATQILKGSIFEIDNNTYYCCVPFGQIELDGKKYFCLSAEAPLFEALRGKKQNQSVLFNGRLWTVNQVY